MVTSTKVKEEMVVEDELEVGGDVVADGMEGREWNRAAVLMLGGYWDSRRALRVQ